MSAAKPSRRLLIGALPAELSLAAVAFELGVTKNTIDNWRRFGRGRGAPPLPASRCPFTGRWLVPLEPLRQWLGLVPEGNE